MSFQDWLLDELKDRGWTQAELARRAKISKGAISNIIVNIRQPGPEICEAIATAFHIPAEDVFRQAGLLNTSRISDPDIDEISEIASKLSREERDDLLQYARLRMKLQEQRGKQRSDPNPAEIK